MVPEMWFRLHLPAVAVSAGCNGASWLYTNSPLLWHISRPGCLYLKMVSTAKRSDG